MPPQSRRQFLRTATTAGLGFLTGPGRNYATAAPAPDKPWSFSLLGDMHFEELVAKEKPARLFFIIHPPVVTYNARAAWCVYNGDLERRSRLLNALGRARAIVLSGHLHNYALLERDTPEGPFTQLAISSVASRLDHEPKDLLAGLDAYTSDLVDLEPAHSPATVGARRAILANEKPHIRRYDYGNFWGHAMIRIHGAKVDADIYQGLAAELWKTVSLAG